MTSRDIAALLFHLDRIACAQTDPHRLEAERIVLAARTRRQAEGNQRGSTRSPDHGEQRLDA